MENHRLAQGLRHLVIFRALRKEPLMTALADLLDAGADQVPERMWDLAAELYPRGMNLHQAVETLIMEDDNFLVRAAAAGKDPGSQAMAWLEQELSLLEEAVASCREMAAGMEAAGGMPLPDWSAEGEPFPAVYGRVIREAPHRGFGVFARYHVFSVSPLGQMVPVEHPDPQRLTELYGYEKEREKIIKNTQALLSGLSANNILLYGDAGTGKSSTVKAIANAYCHQGLRLIQVEKSCLRHIPALLDTLSGLPLKFILFIDDLSFASDDRDFTALKTVIEGSVAARSGNTVVYATSNRRHLVQETFQQRQGDEIHLSDTLEEVASLSARFGIVVTFGKPDKDHYLNLVLQIARQEGLQAEEETLLQEAEAFALRSGGRSPRVARQYVEYKIAMCGGLSCAK